MDRENRFMIYSPNYYFNNNQFEHKNHRQNSFIKTKEIYIHNILTDEEKPLKICMNKTVKNLKKEIEKLFNLKYSLDDYLLRVKIGGQPSGRLIQEDDENKTLFDNHFKSGCLVTFGKDRVSGGNKN